jgi:hypothetical protein
VRTVAYRVALRSTDRTVGIKRSYSKAKRFAEKRSRAVPVALDIHRIDLIANRSELVQHIDPKKDL